MMPQPSARRFVARPVEHARHDLARGDALGGSERMDVVGHRIAQIEQPRRVSRPDRQLVHVGVGGVQEPALFRDRQHRERVGAGLGGDRCAFERVERDIDLGSGADGAADLLADIQHRRFVALALADDDGAVEVELVQRVAHRLDRSGIGGMLVAAADLLSRRDRCIFGHPDHFEDENPVERLAA
jgi:hypothetical protein